MKKRCLLVAVAALLICTGVYVAMPLRVQAIDAENMTAVAVHEIANGTCGDNVTWTLDSNGLLTISGSGEMWDFSNVDPTYLEYKDWSHIK